MRTRRLLAGVLGATMVLSVAGIALAADPAANTYLTQNGTAIDSTTFPNQDCTGIPDSVTPPGPGETLWHFIWTGSKDFDAWGHFTWSTGATNVESTVQGDNRTWWITTPTSTTLDGSQTWTDGVGGQFNLSHVCVNTATPTPTLPPTNTMEQTPTSPAGTSLYLVFGLLLAVAGGLVAYAMRPRRSMR